MPTPHSSRHEGWKHEMNTALKESENSSPFTGKRNDFLSGFSQRQTKRNDCLKRPTKPSKSSADSGFYRLQEKGFQVDKSNDNTSGNDFFDGFSKRQTKREGIGQHQTKLSNVSRLNRLQEKACQVNKSNDKESTSGNDFLDGFSKRQIKREGIGQPQTKPLKFSGLNRLQEQGCQLDNSNDDEYFSEKDFLDGFYRRSKSETDPCGASKHNFYEQELIANSIDRNRKTKKPSAASTQTKRDGFVVNTTTSLNSYAASRRSSYERGWLNEPADLDFSQQYTREPSTASIRTPSPSTQYISTSTSSSKSSATSQGSLDEQEWSQISTEQDLSPKYIREPLTVSIQTPSPSTQYISTTSSRSTSDECPKISEAEWKEIEKKSQHEQKEFLEKFVKEGKFKDVLVSSRMKNVRQGDHIFCQGAFGELYNHHLLCTNVFGDDIYVIEYTGQLGFGAASHSVATSNPLALAAIKEGKLTYEELEKKKAKIRKWPKELQRFPVNEVISRAESRLRKKERDYQPFRNNCEHFVTWCLCGLNTSLQVTSWYQPTMDTAIGAGSAAIQGLRNYGITKGIPAYLKAVGNVSDEILGAVSTPLQAAGFAVGGVIETGFAAWSIRQDYNRLKEGRLSKDQFKINSVTTASKAAFHIAGGIAGSLAGSVVGPVGSVVGGAVGYGVGHAVGIAVGLCYEHAPKIKKAFQEKVIAPVKEMVHNCVKSVQAAGQEIWEQVKSVFWSLFSWW